MAPIIAKQGRFLLYTDTTSKGQSGSPLYTVRGQDAYVVGVHVAGHATLRTNSSVPISLHMSTHVKFNEQKGKETQLQGNTKRKDKCVVLKIIKPNLF